MTTGEIAELPAQIAELRALEKAATPGPWSVETVKTQVGLCHKVGGGWPHRALISGTREQYACIYEDGGDPRNPGAELLANAQIFAQGRNALPALLDAAEELVRLRAALAQAAQSLDSYEQSFDTGGGTAEAAEIARDLGWEGGSDEDMRKFLRQKGGQG